MKLATLQDQFAKALHYQALGDDCDIASGQFTADERMQIYRNNFIISLGEVLSATYPMVEELLGGNVLCPNSTPTCFNAPTPRRQCYSLRKRLSPHCDVVWPGHGSSAIQPRSRTL